MSEDVEIMITGNCTCANTSEFFPFSAFNWCHHYTCVKKTVFLHKYLHFIITILSVPLGLQTLQFMRSIGLQNADLLGLCLCSQCIWLRL